MKKIILITLTLFSLLSYGQWNVEECEQFPIISNQITLINLYKNTTTGDIFMLDGKNYFRKTPNSLVWNEEFYNVQGVSKTFESGMSMIGNVFYIVYFGGDLIKTTNNGITWSYVRFFNEEYLSSVCFTSEEKGYVGGASNLLYTTETAGATWDSLRLDSILSIENIYFANNDTGFVFEGFNATGCYRTINGGVDWEYYDYGIVFEGAFRIKQYNQSIYVCNNTNNILHTNDYGQNWDVISSNNYKISNIEILNEDTIFAVGSTGEFDYGCFFMSVNGGYNWTEIYTRGPYNTFYSVVIEDNQSGYFTGSSRLFRFEKSNSIETIKYNLYSSVYPNPVSNISVLSFENPRNIKTNICIYNVQGKQVINTITDNNKIHITKSNNLNSGIYFYNILQENNQVACGKFIVE